MTRAGQPLPVTVAGARRILIDFDGPFCSVFAGLPAGEVADRLLGWISGAGHEVPDEWQKEADPLALLARVGEEAPEIASAADAVLTELEAEAVQLARVTTEMAPLLTVCTETQRSVAVVSNNSGKAIRSYLDQHGLSGYVQQVVGRIPGEPALMKPSPRLLFDAMGGHEKTACVFIGDSTRDVEAGHAAGVPTVGYANKARKERALADAGAAAVVTSLRTVAEAFAAHPPDLT